MNVVYWVYDKLEKITKTLGVIIILGIVFMALESIFDLAIASQVFMEHLKRLLLIECISVVGMLVCLTIEWRQSRW